MQGLAQGFQMGYGLVDEYKRRKFDEDLRTKQDARAEETHATTQEAAKLKNKSDARANKLNEDWDASLSATSGGVGMPARKGDAGNYGDGDNGASFGAVGMDAPASMPVGGGVKMDLEQVNDAALRAGKITPQEWQVGRERVRLEKYNKALGAKVQQLSQLDDAGMAALTKKFSMDDNSFGQAHWVAGGAPGKPGDPNPKTGKGGYAYVMVGDREPFKLNRVETAQLAAAYELMNESPDNYDLAFKTIDTGSTKMRELGKAFREEFHKTTAANNAATHMANQDEAARSNANTNSARLGLDRQRLEMGKFGAPMQTVGPNGEPTMMVPVTGPNGVSFQAAGLPQGYHLPRSVDPATMDKMAQNMVGQPSGEMVNGKPVPHTYESAYNVARQMLTGGKGQGGPDVAGDAAAVMKRLNPQGAPAAQGRGMPAPAAAPQGNPAVFMNMTDEQLMFYVKAGNPIAAQALVIRQQQQPAEPARGFDSGY